MNLWGSEHIRTISGEAGGGRSKTQFPIFGGRPLWIAYHPLSTVDYRGVVFRKNLSRVLVLRVPK